jgi:glucosylglycerate synthase
VPLDAASQTELEQIERLGGADLVLGILDAEHADESGTALDMAREALGGLSKIARTVVVCNNGAHSTDTPVSEAKAADAQAVILFSLPAPGGAETPQQSWFRAYRKVIALGEKLGARACGVIASQPQSATPQWIYRLVQPILELGFDLVAPHYTRHRMEGLLNTSILAPLHRALYGEQLQNPMGPDFGLSGKLLQRLLNDESGAPGGKENNVVASIASTAACDGLQVCESHLGARSQPPTDWMNLSSLLAEILEPVFLDVERQAVSWQRIRGSRPAPRFGSPEDVRDDSGAVDVHQMIESFQLGAQTLQDIWGIVLPPTTLLELSKLSRLPPDRFRMPDELWVRIVYDFALGHRLRTISRDHLLRSLTPLYLGWIASYALQLAAAGPAEIETRIEGLSKTYETSKPYLVSRWRWPDRFNP